MKSKISEKEARTKKFLLALPGIALPFFCLMFWALGGGKANAASKATSTTVQGINQNLPDAQFSKRKTEGKLDLYEQMNKDSAKIRAAMKNDPFMDNTAQHPAPDSTAMLKQIFEQTAAKFNQRFGPEGTLNTKATAVRTPIEAENEVIKKMNFLKQQLAQGNTVSSGRRDVTGFGDERSATFGQSGDVARLEKMMNAARKAPEPDADLKRLDGMLDKIISIQHPQQGADSSKRLAVPTHQEFLAKVRRDHSTVSILDTGHRDSIENQFYSVNGSLVGNTPAENALEAVVQETQSIVSGSNVKMRLVSDVVLNGVTVPKDEFIYGTASLNNERLKIEVRSLRCGGKILPVNLEVYDLDGLAGIYVPGSISRNVVKESADQGISGIGVTTVDPSIGAQAASAGIQTVKTLFSRKVRLVRVTVRQGYHVLLRAPQGN